MKKLYFFIILLVFQFSATNATHIVGGEFEMLHLEGNTYRISLILYFDEVNGASSILDTENEIFPAIFRKSDGARIQDLNLIKVSTTDVEYTNPICAVGSLSTLRLVYTTVVTLDPNRYDSPLGYYLIWERCCRNYNITNIESNDPSVGIYAGQTFLLEFPPLIDQDGNRFINSSPSLFQPLSDYACVDRLYFADFSGIDPDGDSIAYSVVEPLNTSAGVPVPVLSPPPYPPLTFKENYSPTNMIPGNPGLGIDQNGRLTVRPRFPLLHVFGVLAEEYRDGVKIGEVRRDFQMLVLECPDPGVKPELKVDVPPSNMNDGGIFTESLDLVYTQEDDKCVTFQITDQDGSESVEITAVSVNFEADLENIVSVRRGILADENSVLEVEVCFENCPYIEEVPFIIDFIASDDACPLPLKDTLRMSVLIEPPQNQPPVITSDLVPLPPDSLITIKPGELIDFGLNGFDPDGDPLELYLIPPAALTQQLGFEFEPVIDTGSVNSGFIWNASCEDLKLLQENDTVGFVHEFQFVVRDITECFSDSDTLTVQARIADFFNEADVENIPNVFTPNGDAQNQFWRLPDNFPMDPCENRFLEVLVFNRNGKEVYRSANRNFRWDGGENAPGTYYYQMKFQQAEYNGWISLLK